MRRWRWPHEIDRAFAERERMRGRASRPAEGYYASSSPHTRFGSVVGRGWIEQGGGSARRRLPDAQLRDDGAVPTAPRWRGLVSDYLGEPALISVHKTTLRKADPSVPGAWHQDGYFMGAMSAR